METLPHELITVIGAGLMVRDRCRLFNCCKYWRRECAGPARAMFDWHCRIRLTTRFIRDNIKYNYYDDDCDNTYLSLYSVGYRSYADKITISTNRKNYRDLYNSLEIANIDTIHAEIDYSNICQDMKICKCGEGAFKIILRRYYRIMMKNNNRGIYSIRNLLPHIIQYLDADDKHNFMTILTPIISA